MSAGDPRERTVAIVVDVTVMAPKVPQTLLLLSPVMHWGVLINTNAWYG